MKQNNQISASKVMLLYFFSGVFLMIATLGLAYIQYGQITWEQQHIVDPSYWFFSGFGLFIAVTSIILAKLFEYSDTKSKDGEKKDY